MSIEKKSLISTLKATKKANLAGAPVVSQKDMNMKGQNHVSLKGQNHVTLKANVRSLRATQLKSAKSMTNKKA
jgi:hypothetical protein